jgi:DNA-binding NarL/FixJ family response regulator
MGEYGPHTPHTRYDDGMIASERDRRILTLRRQGYKMRQIAEHLNMSVSGVSDAVRRIKAGRPGRDPRD